MTASFTCSVCGKIHEGAPLSWGPDAPLMWEDLTPAERQRRGEINADQCIIDDRYFFVRGRIEIPVTDTGELFAWLVWAEVDRADFNSISNLWDIAGREKKAPIYSARLANQLPIYEPSTLGLETRLHTRPLGSRPLVEVVGSHRLREEQQGGITSHYVQAIADQFLQP